LSKSESVMTGCAGGVASAHLLDDERGGDQISRLFALQQRRVLHPVRHRHGRHESRNVLVVDHHFLPLGTDADDLAADLVTARLGLAAARRHRQRSKEHDSACTSHALTLPSAPKRSELLGPQLQSHQ
jgi:hypothetical protein